MSDFLCMGRPISATFPKPQICLWSKTDVLWSMLFGDPAQDDPRQRRPDIALARQKLEWEPQMQLREGLTWTINYFDSLLRGSASVPAT